MKKQAPGDALRKGKMIELKSVRLLVEFLLLLFQETEKEKVKRRGGALGEQKKIENPENLFVERKMRLMKMDGPLYDVKSQEKHSLNWCFIIGLVTFKDYYICA